MTRWLKLLGDVQAAQGRIAMMVLAIAAGLFGVGVILSAFTILTREMKRNYLTTNPATATFELDKLDAGLLKRVRGLPEIAAAEAGLTVQGKIQLANGTWMPLLLFIIPDFQSAQINRFTFQSGQAVPATGSILLEREALKLIQGTIGGRYLVQTANGSRQKVSIAGIVHDPGLAPASQEQTAWAYATPATLAQLGERNSLRLLKVIIRPATTDLQMIEKTIAGLALWLKKQGRTVEEIRIPPPAMHPHQTQMTAILLLLLLFSGLALLLGAILSANTVAALLGQQIRQIGIMKTIGARTSQITVMYLVLVGLIGLTSSLIALPLSLVAGRGLSAIIAELLNFNIQSNAVPAWVLLLQVASGVLVPVLVALIPILSATRTTVRQAIDDVGVNRLSGLGAFDAFLSRFNLDRSLLLTVRNTFRRRGRLLLTLGLLSAAGAMFMTSLNVMAGWQNTLNQAAIDRHYDAEIRFSQDYPLARVQKILKNMPAVEKIEPWNRSPSSPHRPDNLEILRTYPDGGHGTFMLRSVPDNSQLIQLQLLSGRWLEPNDNNGVVLNHSAKAFFPKANIGDTLTLSLEGQAASYKLIGVARELISPASAYVNPSTYAQATSSINQTNAIRLVFKGQSIAALSAETEQILEKAGVRVSLNISETTLDNALNGHVYILIFALIAMSILMAIVGGLGLMSAISTSVIERTREFGIMRTIGAKNNTILRNIISEGLLIGVLSWVLAVPLSLPLSLGIGNLLGTMAFRFPLSLTVSFAAVAIWFLIIFIGSILTSAYPAWTASRQTIRATLAHL